MATDIPRRSPPEKFDSISLATSCEADPVAAAQPPEEGSVKTSTEPLYRGPELGAPEAIVAPSADMATEVPSSTAVPEESVSSAVWLAADPVAAAQPPVLGSVKTYTDPTFPFSF